MTTQSLDWRSKGIALNAILERWIFVWLLSAMVIGYTLHRFLSVFAGAIVALFAYMTFVTATYFITRSS